MDYFYHMNRIYKKTTEDRTRIYGIDILSRKETSFFKSDLIKKISFINLINFLKNVKLIYQKKSEHIDDLLNKCKKEIAKNKNKSNSKQDEEKIKTIKDMINFNEDITENDIIKIINSRNDDETDEIFQSLVSFQSNWKLFDEIL